MAQWPVVSSLGTSYGQTFAASLRRIPKAMSKNMNMYLRIYVNDFILLLV